MGRKRDTDSLVTDPPDNLTPTQRICRVDQICGNNLYSVTLPPQASASDITADSVDAKPALAEELQPGSKVLVELPPKFRNTLWIRRGGYVLVDLHAGEDRRQNKIVGTVAAVIQDVRVWRRMAYWPWPAPVQPTATVSVGAGGDGDAGDDLLQANTNRRRYDSDEDD